MFNTELILLLLFLIGLFSEHIKCIPGHPFVFSGFIDIIFEPFDISFSQKTSVATVLEQDGPYTLFAPTNIAFNFLKPGYLDFLTSEEVQCKYNNCLFMLHSLYTCSIQSHKHHFTFSFQSSQFRVRQNYLNWCAIT